MNLKRFLPILNWLPNYQRAWLAGDLSAGLTVGVMLVPQGMAYAMIAGLPPVYGLYAALLPQIVYAIFGTSRQLAVGPVAMDSLLVAAGVTLFAEARSEHYITLVLLLAFMMGTVQFVFGLLRMGFLVSFLSRPVISGFTTAAALIIGVNQLKHLVGVDLPGGQSIFLILKEAALQVSHFNWISVGIGVVGIALIISLKKINRAIPGALIAVILGILVVYFALDPESIKIVGDVPEGLPPIGLPDFNAKEFQDLIPMALTLAVIAFMEAISVAKAIQLKHRDEYQLDANQEMVALGLSNMVGSIFGAYPTTGGFSRTAVNEQAGAKTNLAAVISAVLIGLTLLFLTPLFYYLPKAILASVILVAVYGLLDFQYPRQLWKTNRRDLFMLAVTFGFTLGVGITYGIAVGVGVSILMMIWQTTRPHFAVLGKLPEGEEYRNVKRFDDLRIRPEILVLRYDAQLYFANIGHFSETITKEVEVKGEQLKLVVLNCESINYIDATALQGVRELLQDLHKKEIKVYFSSVIGPVRDYLRKTGFIEALGEESFFLDIQPAIDYYDEKPGARQLANFKVATQSNTFHEGGI